MASYRYERDIDPKDIAPRKERQYTRKERWANWWDYNLKWVILIGIAAAFVAYNFIGQYFFVTKPDHNVAVVAPYYLPEDTVNALQDALAAYGEDRNGDGKVVVTLNVYTLDYSDTETQTESAAYLTMAGTTKLAADVQGGLSSVFLLWDPAGFEDPQALRSRYYFRIGGSLSAAAAAFGQVEILSEDGGETAFLTDCISGAEAGKQAEGLRVLACLRVLG